jgi:hypothetical protein
MEATWNVGWHSTDSKALFPGRHNSSPQIIHGPYCANLLGRKNKEVKQLNFGMGRGGKERVGQERFSTPQTSCWNQILRKSFRYHKQGSLLPQRKFMKLENLTWHSWPTFRNIWTILPGCLRVKELFIHGLCITEQPLRNYFWSQYYYNWVKSRSSQYSDLPWAGRPRGRSSSPGRGKIFLVSTSSRPVLGPTRSIQWTPGALSLEAKLNTHLQLVPRIRGSTHPLPHTSSWRNV